MLPEKRFQFSPPPASGSWLTRAARALILERRLPDAVRARFDAALIRLGRIEHTQSIAGYRVTSRRGTVDADFLANVLVNEEYFAHGGPPAIDATIVDIGANIGSFTLAAAKHARAGRIIAVEPVPENLRLLRRNVEQNGLGQVEILPGAVTHPDAHGSVTLHVADPGFHSTAFDRGRGSINVRGWTLAEIFERYQINRCDFLKIDCEGAEFDFLPTVEPETWRKVKRVAMEFSAPVLDWVNGQAPTAAQLALKRASGDRLVALLQEQGFTIDVYEDCIWFRAGFIFARRPL